jgi:hypothetical protein
MAAQGLSHTPASSARRSWAVQRPFAVGHTKKKKEKKEQKKLPARQRLMQQASRVPKKNDTLRVALATLVALGLIY